MAGSFVRETSDGVTVTVRVAPRARSNRIEGLANDAQGGAALKVAVTAAPEDGRANDAVIALLAKSWKIPKSSFRVVQGATARHKILHIAGPARDLAATIGRLTATSPVEGR